MSTAALVISLLLIGIGILKDSYEIKASGATLMIFAVGLGFVLSGLFIPVRATYERKTDFKIVRTEQMAAIAVDSCLLKVRDIETYNRLDNVKYVYLKAEYNSYGIELNREIVWEEGQ